MDNKICIVCDIEKHINTFHKNNGMLGLEHQKRCKTNPS